MSLWFEAWICSHTEFCASNVWWSILFIQLVSNSWLTDQTNYISECTFIYLVDQWKLGSLRQELYSAPPKVHESLQRQKDSSKMLVEKIKCLFYPYMRNCVFWNIIHWSCEYWKTNGRQVWKDSVWRPSMQAETGFKQIKNLFVCLLIFSQPSFIFISFLGRCFHGSSFSLPPDCITVRWTIILFSGFHVCPLLSHWLSPGLQLSISYSNGKEHPKSELWNCTTPQLTHKNQEN